jgi:N-acetylneuraminate lyase
MLNASKLTAFVLIVTSTSAQAPPSPILLHSAYSPFTSSGALNVSVVPLLAAQAAAKGVNTVFICGSMAEFDTMTVEERKELAGAWLEHGHAQGMYVIINVGTTVTSEALELAAHAEANGADAIASMAPYYTRPSGVSTLLPWLMNVASAAPSLPFW